VENAVFESYCKDKLAPLTLRLGLGFFCVYHGFLKIQASGGAAWYPGLPKGWQLAIAWGEFVAGLAILFGIRCRLAAGAALVISGGTFLWNALRLPILSVEPMILVLLVAIALVFLGGGGLSLDGRNGAKPAFKRGSK
jgi:uncharacterized membrane protein YphA (DoxX/SURF4 family)